MNRAEILQKLHATGQQIITVADLIRAGFLDHLTPTGVYVRLQQLPEGERPVDWGAIRAGGNIAWVNPEAAAEWAAHHLDYWAKRIGATR